MALGHVDSDNIFFIFAVKNYIKPKAIIWKKLGKVALGDAITLWILFYAFPIKAYVKHVTPTQDGSILAKRA